MPGADRGDRLRCRRLAPRLLAARRLAARQQLTEFRQVVLMPGGCHQKQHPSRHVTPDEHQHLRLLAGLPALERTDPYADLTPRLQLLVDAALPNIASVCDIHFDYLAWNRAYALMRQDPAVLPADRRNLLWMMFAGPDRGAGTRHWEPAARAVLSQFRIAASQRPTDPRFAELVAALTEASPQFRAWWAEYPVRSFRPVTIVIDHPAAGPVTVQLYQLRLAERPDLTLVLQVPASADDLRRLTTVLDNAAAPPGRPSRPCRAAKPAPPS